MGKRADDAAAGEEQLRRAADDTDDPYTAARLRAMAADLERLSQRYPITDDG